MKPLKIKTGDKFDKLMIVEECKGKRERRFLVRCECGTEKIVYLSDMRKGKTKSCGCLSRENSQNKATHGHNRRNGKVSSTYSIWAGMIQRCTNPNNKSFKNYGGRGIKVCANWCKFENFLKDMGERPEGMSIERVDNDGGYFPDNCKWIPLKDQSKNRRMCHINRNKLPANQTDHDRTK